MKSDAVEINLGLFLLGQPYAEINQSEVSTFPTKKSFALLIYLAAIGRPCTREELSTLFWPRSTKERARKNLRDALYHLRKTLGPILNASSPTITFRENCQPWSDIDIFRHLLKSSENLVGEDLVGEDIPPKKDKSPVALYRGEFLQGFSIPGAPAFDDWVAIEREQLHLLAMQGFEQLLTLSLDSDSYEESMDLCNRLLFLEPWNESAHRTKIELLLQNGQQDVALEQYQAYERILADEFNAKPAEAYQSLYQKIKQSAPSNVHLPTYKESPHAERLPKSEEINHNIKPALTVFVGRKQEVASISDNFFQLKTRLLTILGPSGIGKTALANHMAELAVKCVEVTKESDAEHRLDFDGIYFVGLESVQPQAARLHIASDFNNTEALAKVPALGQGIVNAIAETLGLRLSDHLPLLEQLLNAISDQKLLLILDCFEHLISEAPVIDQLLDGAPQLYLITTSQQPLRLMLERELRLSGLPFKFLDEHDESEQEQSALALTDALDLFLVRAHLDQTTFTKESALQKHPDSELLVQIQQICEMVEGMPLAIEFAAALTHSLPVADIAALLAKDYNILKGDLVGVKEEHKSIRIMLDASWLRLTLLERQIVARLSVFHSGFTLPAAAEVVNAAEAILTDLVDKSLLQKVTSDDGTTRYRIHALIQRYAAEQLEANIDDKQRVFDRHYRYYSTLLNNCVTQWHQHYDREPMDRAVADVGNFAAAWEWVLSTRNIAEISNYLDSLFVYYRVRSRIAEAISIVEQALTKIEQLPEYVSAIEKIRWLHYLSQAHIVAGQLNDSEYYAYMGLQMLGHRIPDGKALRLLQVVADAGKQILAIASGHKIFQLLPRKNLALDESDAEKTIITAQIYRQLVYNHYIANDSLSLIQFGLRYANLALKSTDVNVLMVANAQFGMLCGMAGLHRLAEKYIQSVEEHERTSNDLISKALSTVCCGLYYLSVGQWTYAERYLERSLQFNQQMGNWFGSGNCLALLNISASRRGDSQRSAAIVQMLEQQAADSYNQSLLVWIQKIEAANSYRRGYPEQAISLLEEVLPHSGRTLINDVGYMTDISTKAAAYAKVGDYYCAEEAAEVTLEHLRRSVPMSIIHLHCFDCLLVTYSCLWHESLQPSGVLSSSRSKEFKKQMSQLMRMLVRYSWHHPIAKAYIYFHRGRFLWLTGKKRKAVDQWQMGILAAQDGGLNPLLGRLHLELGTHLADPEKRKFHINQAIQIFTDCDMQGFIQSIQNMDAADNVE